MGSEQVNGFEYIRSAKAVLHALSLMQASTLLPLSDRIFTFCSLFQGGWFSWNSLPAVEAKVTILQVEPKTRRWIDRKQVRRRGGNFTQRFLHFPRKTVLNPPAT
jgi:hypothetical protein